MNAKFPLDQVINILNRAVTAYPRAWDHAHVTGDPERLDFIILAARDLYAASGGTVGGNWRNGEVGRLSADGISIEGTDGKFYFADVIVKAKDNLRGDPWEPSIPGSIRIGDGDLLRDGAGRYAPQGFVHANQLPAVRGPEGSTPAPPGPTPQPPTPPPPPPKPPYAGDQFWVENFGRQFLADIRRAGQEPNEGSWIWAGRVSYDHYVNGMPIQDAVKKQREGPDGWLRALGLTS